MHKQRERIVMAANSYLNKDGTETILLVGVRHWDMLMHQQFVVISDDVDKSTEEQGFVTNLGRYVSREEAFKIAYKEHQLLRIEGWNKFTINDDGEVTGILYSENIY